MKKQGSMRRERFRLWERCVSSALTAEIDLSGFHCGDESLDYYFHNRAQAYEEEMLSRNYALVTQDGTHEPVAIFSICNTSINMPALRGNVRNRLQRRIPNPKRRRTYPALLMGRIGVDVRYQGQGIGSQVIDYIKHLYTHKSARGLCRFLLVDAINRPDVIGFYQNNGFVTLFETEEDERQSFNIGTEPRTRMIYCDLKLWCERQAVRNKI